MTIYKQGDMWSVEQEVDHFIITTNSFIKRNGALVMGAGIAKQLRNKHPGIDIEIGYTITSLTRPFDTQIRTYYGLILGTYYGMFQVKYHFKDPASLDLIKRSTKELQVHAETNPTKKYALNFPGVGNGKLAYELVKPVMDTLPDNVQVWTYP